MVLILWIIGEMCVVGRRMFVIQRDDLGPPPCVLNRNSSFLNIVLCMLILFYSILLSVSRLLSVETSFNCFINMCFALFAVERQLPGHRGTKVVRDRRWEESPWLLREAYGRRSRGWRLGWWMEGLCLQDCWWQRQARLPHEAGYPHHRYNAAKDSFTLSLVTLQLLANL